MDKIKRLFQSFRPHASSVGRGLRSFWRRVSAKVFWRREEARKKKIILLAIWIVAALVLAGGIWMASVKLSKSQGVTSSKTAKAIVVTSKKCAKDNCWDAGLFIAALINKGVVIESVSTTTIESLVPVNGGAALVKKYGITKVPTVIVEFTGGNKPDLTKFFSAGLGQVHDNKFVLLKILAPYFDMTAKKFRGEVKITYLSDQSCPNCYNVALHEIALKNLGVDTGNSETYDVASEQGKALIKKYNITKVPTVIITGEVSEYSAFVETWPTVGAIEPDGAYVFTGMDNMGGYYRDLKTGKIIKAKTNNQ